MPESNEIVLIEDSNIVSVTDEHPVPEELQHMSADEINVLIAKSNLDQVRTIRDSLLLETDWTQQADVPDSTKIKWQEYRQALRDITLTCTSMNDVVWPEKPL
jgi:hypothetical protein